MQQIKAKVHILKVDLFEIELIVRNFLPIFLFFS